MKQRERLDARSNEFVAEDITRHTKQEASQRDARDEDEVIAGRGKIISTKVIHRYSFTDEQKKMHRNYDRQV